MILTPFRRAAAAAALAATAIIRTACTLLQPPGRTSRTPGPCDHDRGGEHLSPRRRHPLSRQLPHRPRHLETLAAGGAGGRAGTGITAGPGAR